MTRALLVRAWRVAGFLLVVAAEIHLVVVLGDRFVPADHYSYFTIESNLFAALVLLAGAFRPVPAPVRGAAVLYLVTTGIVYAVLLRGVDVQTPEFANFALHSAMPLLVAVDWLADPPRTRLRGGHVLWWLVFPLAYVAYTLVRGSVVGWYPYPFLDPAQGGYGQVAAMSLFVACTIGVLAVVVAGVGNRMGSSSRVSEPR
ncbi:Pr6Pr family membrane protein [Prauserella shujinwangii]|uniref:Pr6Pr family membrane protein n=1 Tax=Prauserella shujinwangii TaxID=1453103 RepID=UPI0011B1F89E|nr:Pr6Pr family membrane protein [Prauserella shujinwangii]